ncbi:MAG: DNA polymerase III subunit beta [Anaerolineaceae bacterium]|nr:DNA polymerase III subunit beta [Anaerolineaceae bacterium]MBN2677404.1 DNA polymerase III subunit beta [Anaerolineaceae bacterium]
MKINVSQQQFSHGLSIVSRAVSSRSTLPVLSNILIATDEGRLRLSATNLELGITTWIGAQIEEEGATTVPARTIVDLVTALPNTSVQMELDTTTQTLNVVSGTSNTDIKCIDAQEFPPIPTPDLKEGIELSVAEFKQNIQQVGFSASSDEARPILTGVLMTIEGKDVSMVATDGFRISVKKSTLSKAGPTGVSITVPARALGELARVAVNAEEKITMVLPKSRGQVIFHLKDVELVSQLIEGNFPDYRAIIPQSFKTRTELTTESLLKACKQAEIIAREGTNVAKVSINPTGENQPGKIELSATAEQTGSSEITVDASVDGVPLLIAFNVRYLREVLEVVSTANVSLETNAANTPAMLKMVGDDSYMHVIMPMHLG